MAPMVSVEVWW